MSKAKEKRPHLINLYIHSNRWNTPLFCPQKQKLVVDCFNTKLHLVGELSPHSITSTHLWLIIWKHLVYVEIWINWICLGHSLYVHVYCLYAFLSVLLMRVSELSVTGMLCACLLNYDPPSLNVLCNFIFVFFLGPLQKLNDAYQGAILNWIKLLIKHFLLKKNKKVKKNLKSTNQKVWPTHKKSDCDCDRFATAPWLYLTWLGQKFNYHPKQLGSNTDMLAWQLWVAMFIVYVWYILMPMRQPNALFAQHGYYKTHLNSSHLFWFSIERIRCLIQFLAPLKLSRYPPVKKQSNNSKQLDTVRND